MVSERFVVLKSEKGTVEMRFIKLLVEHINEFVRNFVPESLAYCNTLDGHRFRNGYACIEYCRKVGCEVSQLPSDTTHFLQLCNRAVKKSSVL